MRAEFPRASKTRFRDRGTAKQTAGGLIRQAFRTGKMVTIRRIRTGEADIYKQIRLASLRDAPYAYSSTLDSALRRSAGSWREQADGAAAGPDRAIFLAFDGDSPVGIAALYRLPSPDGAGEVIQVWVESGHRRRRVGWKLMDAVFAWARGNGFRTVAANIIAGNERAIRFYLAYGFSSAGHEPKTDVGGIFLVRRVAAEAAESE
jgi:GNAT superfamily N-acetyltransferase